VKPRKEDLVFVKVPDFESDTDFAFLKEGLYRGLGIRVVRCTDMGQTKRIFRNFFRIIDDVA